MLGFPLYVARRYLLARRKQVFVPVVTSLSVLGVTIGVGALVIALSLMTGFEEEIKDRIIGSNPHLWVFPLTEDGLVHDSSALATRLSDLPQVEIAVPLVLYRGLLVSTANPVGAVAHATAVME